MTKPTKLEEEIDIAIKPWVSGGARQPAAKAAAEVAKGYIEKAFEAGMAYAYDHTIGMKEPNFEPSLAQWMKEEGIA